MHPSPPAGPPRVGPYLIGELLGAGGMGQVFAARHLADGSPLAIKVITAEVADQPGYGLAFRREARAMARLDHPGVVRVHDFGRLDASAPRPLPAGSPYLVMDRLPGGALRPDLPGLDWPRLAGLLEALLDALAHAHARGVIHRDLKPDNVLLDAAGQPVLTDFGVATHEAGEDLTTDAHRAYQTAGTPAYMAPEQIRGLLREQGPWTDLYALGSLAWALIAGAAPLLRSQPLATMVAQLTQPLPPLHPRFPVPTGLEAWLRRLLTKEPSQRFQCAADAAWALGALAGAALEVSPWPAAERPEDLATAPTLERPSLSRLPFTGELPVLTEPVGPASRVPRSALPERWQPARDLDPRAARPGAGLGLFELRTLPFIGREAERDQLWAALRGAVAEGRPRLVTLEGPSGYGKRRLAGWLTQRARELGAARILHVRASPQRGPGHGLAAALRRLLRAAGLSRVELVEHIQQQLAALGYADPEEAQALAEVIEPATGAERARTRITHLERSEQRHAVIRRLVQRLLSERPLVLHLDDVQWSPQSLGFVRGLLDSLDDEGDHPLLVLLTADSDRLFEHPEAAEQLAALRCLPAAERLLIGPLPAASRRALIQSMLGLSAELSRRVDERSGGHPLFAVQLIGAWVEGGMLSVGPQGIEPRPGADLDAALPADVAAIWDVRLAAALAEAEPAAAAALELAAALGLEVDPAEWRAACLAAELPVPQRLVEAWLDHGLAQPDGDGTRRAGASGFSFVHSMLRAALLRRAAAGGRLRAHHQACAAALRDRPQPPHDRIAHHLVEAGDYSAALAPLSHAAQAALDQGDAPLARAQLEALHKALSHARPPEDDPRWGASWILDARLALLREDFDDAATLARQAHRAAQRHAWPGVQAQLHLVLAGALRDRGQPAEASAHLSDALRLGETLGDANLLCRAHLLEGSVRLRQGETGPAEASFRAALRLATATGDQALAGLAAISLGQIEKRAGHLEAAARHTEAAEAHFTAASNRDGLARCANQRGELARLAGDLDAARAAYQAALDLWRIIDAPDALYAEANLGLMLVEAKRPAEALATLSRAATAFRRRRRWPMVAAITAARLPALAATGAWAEFRRAVDEAHDLISRTQLRDVDAARMLESAGRRAAAADQSGLARAALRLAHAQWCSLDRPDRARAIEATLNALP